MNVCACVCVRVQAGAEGRKAPRSLLPAGFVGMTETGAAEWALCTSSVSPRHMVTHGRMPTPTRCARARPPTPRRCSAVQLGSV